MDSYGGAKSDPLSLHKFVFGSNNPVNRNDPSGHDDQEGASNVAPRLKWPASTGSEKLSVAEYEQDGDGVHIEIGALTSTSSKMYKWVQKVTLNFNYTEDIGGGAAHDVIPANTQFYDGDSIGRYPQYYGAAGSHVNWKAADGKTYNYVFEDRPQDPPDLISEQPVISFNAVLYFVSVNSDSDMNPTPIFRINYGYNIYPGIGENDDVVKTSYPTISSAQADQVF
jgi:hypothetical protein